MLTTENAALLAAVIMSPVIILAALWCVGYVALALILPNPYKKSEEQNTL